MNRDGGAVEPNYGLTMDRRVKAVITGVTDVESFDEQTVVLATHGGRMLLTGKGLHVSSLMLEEGRLMLEGTIDSIAYDGPSGRRKGGFFRKALG